MDKKIKNLKRIFYFLHKVENLKSTLRYMFTKTGRTESSAEHSWRLALMSFMTAKELNLDINIERAMKIALVHDIAESITGDISFIRIVDKEISREEKTSMERRAMIKLKNILPEKIGLEVYDLWEEYEKKLTKEAKFIKALDKLETLTQLVEAGCKKYKRPELIPNYANEAVEDFPALEGILKIIKRKLKQEFAKCKIPWKKGYQSK